MEELILMTSMDSYLHEVQTPTPSLSPTSSEVSMTSGCCVVETLTNKYTKLENGGFNSSVNYRSMYVGTNVQQEKARMQTRSGRTVRPR